MPLSAPLLKHYGRAWLFNLVTAVIACGDWSESIIEKLQRRLDANCRLNGERRGLYCCRPGNYMRDLWSKWLRPTVNCGCQSLIL